MQIPVEKIGAVIGPGGKMIRSIIEETGAKIDVEDDGRVFIATADGEAAKKAVAMVEGLTREAKIGDVYLGKVVRIKPFGAFVEHPPRQGRHGPRLRARRDAGGECRGRRCSSAMRST